MRRPCAKPAPRDSAGSARRAGRAARARAPCRHASARPSPRREGGAGAVRGRRARHGLRDPRRGGRRPDGDGGGAGGDGTDGEAPAEARQWAVGASGNLAGGQAGRPSRRCGPPRGRSSDGLPSEERGDHPLARLGRCEAPSDHRECRRCRNERMRPSFVARNVATAAPGARRPVSPGCRQDRRFRAARCRARARARSPLEAASRAGKSRTEQMSLQTPALGVIQFATDLAVEQVLGVKVDDAHDSTSSASRSRGIGFDATPHGLPSPGGAGCGRCSPARGCGRRSPRATTRERRASPASPLARRDRRQKLSQDLLSPVGLGDLARARRGPQPRAAGAPDARRVCWLASERPRRSARRSSRRSRRDRTRRGKPGKAWTKPMRASWKASSRSGCPPP